MPRSSPVFPPKLPTRGYRSAYKKRVTHYHLTLKVPTLEIAEILFEKARKLLENAGRQLPPVLLNICLSSASEVVETPAVSAPVDQSASTKIEELTMLVQKVSNEHDILVGAMTQLAKSFGALCDRQQATFDAVSNLGQGEVSPASPADPSEGTSSPSDELYAFAEISLLDEASLPGMIAADQNKNYELACSFYIVNPPSYLEKLSEVQFVQDILAQLAVTAQVISTKCVSLGRQPAIEVILNARKAAEVCAKFRSNGSFFSFPTNMLLKVKRTLFLRYAMYRMFRSLESSPFKGAVIRKGWFVTIGDQDLFTPYSFLYPTLHLKSGSFLPVSSG